MPQGGQGTGETREEAQRRRALQAEKRKLAAKKAEEEKTRRAMEAQTNNNNNSSSSSSNKNTTSKVPTRRATGPGGTTTTTTTGGTRSTSATSINATSTASTTTTGSGSAATAATTTALGGIRRTRLVPVGTKTIPTTTTTTKGTTTKGTTTTKATTTPSMTKSVQQQHQQPSSLVSRTSTTRNSTATEKPSVSLKQKPQEPPENKDNTASAAVVAATTSVDVMDEDNNDHDNHNDDEEEDEDAMETEPIVQQEEQQQQPKKSRTDPDGKTHDGIQTNATTTTTTPTSVGTTAVAAATTDTHPTVAMRTTKHKAPTARDKREAATTSSLETNKKTIPVLHKTHKKIVKHNVPGTTRTTTTTTTTIVTTTKPNNTTDTGTTSKDKDKQSTHAMKEENNNNNTKATTSSSTTTLVRTPPRPSSTRNNNNNKGLDPTANTSTTTTTTSSMAGGRRPQPITATSRATSTAASRRVVTKPLFGSPMPQSMTGQDPPVHNNTIIMTAGTTTTTTGGGGGAAETIPIPTIPSLPSTSSTTMTETTIPLPPKRPEEPPATNSTTTTLTKASNIPQSFHSSSSRLPNASALEELYAELDKHDDDEYDDDDDDDDDEDLRQQALQVIAERRDRERLLRIQDEAATYERRRQKELDDLAKLRRQRLIRWGPLLGALVTVWLAIVIAGYHPDGLSIWELVQTILLFRTSSSSRMGQKHVVTCFLDSNLQYNDVTNGSKVMEQLYHDTDEEQVMEMDPQCLEPTTSNDKNKEKMAVAHPQSPPPPSVPTSTIIIQWVTCPPGALCHGGRLLKCPPLYEIHENWCYLSMESNETLNAIEQLLHDWTVQTYCQMDDNHNGANDTIAIWTERPFFHYSRVVGELECGYDLRLLYLGNVTTTTTTDQIHTKQMGNKKKKKKGKDANTLLARFVLEKEGPNLWLALHPDIPLMIPTTCYLGRIVLGLIFFGTTLTGLALLALMNFLWQLIRCYFQALRISPWYVGIASVTLVGLFTSLYRRFWQRYYRRKRSEQVLMIRNEVYRRLQDELVRATAVAAGTAAAAGGGGRGGAATAGRGGDDDIALSETAGEISANWLCQDLAWSLYQMSHCDRTYMMKEIWPFVVRDITQDERIGKTIRLSSPLEQQPQQPQQQQQQERGVEYWKWLPPLSSPTTHPDYYYYYSTSVSAATAATDGRTTTTTTTTTNNRHHGNGGNGGNLVTQQGRFDP